MKVSLKWLRDYLDIGTPVEELAERLTMAGMEVKGREAFDHDVILDLDVTPNRPDCLSIIGIARELAALTEQELNLPQVHYEEPGAPIDQLASVEIADAELCSRYCASLITGLKVGPSPPWMQQRLLACGMRPINNIVDVTNYVMLEWGQPLHAFDDRKLKEGKIIVRRARNGEVITTLDGMERPLTDDMLVIADAQSPVALAGVMGGAESEVTPGTTSVLLESANFNRASIRYASARLRLQSEASSRFEKGISPELTLPALRRATQLLLELAGGQAAAGVIDVYPGKVEGEPIALSSNQVKRLLGIEIDIDQIAKVLTSLGCRCEPAAPSSALGVTVPYWRTDVSSATDLVEEVARMYGYDRIPVTLMDDELPPQRDNRELEVEERARDILVACGLNEIVSYPVTNLESVGKLSPGTEPPDPGAYIRIANPLNSEREYMRQTLMNTMLETVWANLRFTDRLALFEIGRVYLPVPGEDLPEEPRRLCVSMTGPRAESSWLSGDAHSMGFFDLKGVVEALLERLNVEGASFEPTQHPAFHPGRAARLTAGDVDLGILGELHPTVRDSFDLPASPVCLLELDMEALTEATPEVEFMNPISRYPAVRQDLAIIVDEDVPGARVEEVIRSAGGKLLVDITLFDVYRGEQIPKGKRSLAYSLTFQSLDGTLTDKQVAKLQGRILKKLRKQIGANLRA